MKNQKIQEPSCIFQQSEVSQEPPLSIRCPLCLWLKYILSQNQGWFANKISMKLVSVYISARNTQLAHSSISLHLSAVRKSLKMKEHQHPQVSSQSTLHVYIKHCVFLRTTISRETSYGLLLQILFVLSLKKYSVL